MDKVLSTLIIPLPFKRNPGSLFHFVLTPLPHLPYFFLNFFLPSLSLKIPTSPVFFKNPIYMQLRMPGSERG